MFFKANFLILQTAPLSGFVAVSCMGNRSKTVHIMSAASPYKQREQAPALGPENTKCLLPGFPNEAELHL